MFSFLFSEKYQFDNKLQQFLNTDTHNLCESQLHNIMSALRGEDINIKSQIAFAKFKKNITAFQLEMNELVIIKQLIVLDKLVEDNLFSSQIASLNFFSIDNNKPNHSNHMKENIRRCLCLFWRIIKDKSIINNQNDHILMEKRSQRENYLKKLKFVTILNQLVSIQPFFTNIFELVYYLQQPNSSQQRQMVQWKKKGIIQYITVHLLYKLLYLYNCQNTINKHLISKLQILSQGQIIKVRRSIVKFKENCNKLIIFMKEHQDIKGFQNNNIDQIKIEMNQKIIKFIDDYLHSLQIKMNQPILQKLPISISLGKLQVDNKPNLIGKMNIFPRLQMKTQQSLHMLSSKSIIKKKQYSNQHNAFLNWQNSYSHQFPQKQIMTVDLILQLKLQQTLTQQYQQQQIDDQRDNNVYFSSKSNFDNRSTFTSSNYSINFFKVKEYAINVLEKRDFTNIYSKMPNKWNQH